MAAVAARADGGTDPDGSSDTPVDPDPGAAASPSATAVPAPAAPPLPADAAPAAPTVQSLAAAIVQRAGAKVSRFEVVLNPEGLGRVDVSLSIGAQGKLSAAMTFDSPQGLSALQGRADDLASALRQAGFDLAPGALSFTPAAPSFASGGQGGGFPQDGPSDTPSPGSGRAFAAAAELDIPPPAWLRPVRGLDIRI